jgi:hypothetical protein
MSVEHIFYCDAPECQRHVQTRKDRPPAFLTVTDEAGDMHFCGWDCILRYGSTVEPEQVIEQ